jgi:hypothetical protein
VTRDFLFWLFFESSSPGPQKIPSVTFLYKYLTFVQLLTAGVVDAGGKLRLCIGYKTSAVVPGHRRSQISRIYIDRRDTGGKFAAGVNDAGGSLSLIRYQQQGFINDKISDCRDLKLNIVLVEKAIFQ